MQTERAPGSGTGPIEPVTRTTATREKRARSGREPMLTLGCPSAVRSLSASCHLRNVGVIMERDWHAIEKLYVFGEVARVREDGSEQRVFLTIRAIAQRFGVSRSAVGEKAFNDDWVGRRLRFRAALHDATWQTLMAHEIAKAAALPRA